MDRARRMSASYERAESCRWWVQPPGAASGEASLHLPAPKLPFTGSESTFGGFHVAFLMSGVTVHPVDDVCPLRGERTPESAEKSTPKTPPGDRGNHSNTATIHTYFKCTLRFFIPFKILPLQPV